jgi:DNA-binding NarL/FixJ family response regulator
MPAIHVAVISDDRLSTDGLLRILSAERSIDVVRRDDHPNILLVDSRVADPLRPCLESRHNGGAAVIMLSAPDDPAWAAGALRAGARGILPKSANGEQLIRAIHDVHEGSMWAPRRVMAACIGLLTESVPPKPVADPSLDNRLSERERQIFRCAATGLGNKELAERLAISEATVKVHLTRIFQKLGVRGRGELAAVYYGILSDRPKS